MLTSGFGLYGHIRANRIRSYLLVGGLFLLIPLLFFGLMLMGGDSKHLSKSISSAYGSTISALPMLVLATAAWVGIGYWRNVAIIGRVVGAQAASGDDERRLLRLIEPLCISRGMTTPKLAIVPSAALNAFASGVNPSQYTITVTQGLLDGLDDRELEGVLAHELTHIRNDDVRLMIFAVLIAGVVSFCGEMLFRTMAHTRGRVRVYRSGGKKGGSAAVLLGLAAIVLAFVLAQLIRMALSRSREFMADAGAVELTKDPDALISALRKIAGHSDLEGVPSGVMDMCFENKKNGIGDLFSTHPAIEARIAALVESAGGTMPDLEAPPAPERPAIGAAPPPDVAGFAAAPVDGGTDGTAAEDILRRRMRAALA